MKDKLIKIPLQFFGDPGDDDDFSDDFYNDEADDASVGGEETEPDSNNEIGEDNGTGNDSNAADESDDDADVAAELRALGYVGTNLKELAKDMKRKREDNAAQAASAEKKALKSEGKSHIKSSNPGKSAGGGGTGTITESMVASFAERTGCSKERARELLGKHSRMMN